MSSSDIGENNLKVRLVLAAVLGLAQLWQTVLMLWSMLPDLLTSFWGELGIAWVFNLGWFVWLIVRLIAAAGLTVNQSWGFWTYYAQVPLWVLVAIVEPFPGSSALLPDTADLQLKLIWLIGANVVVLVFVAWVHWSAPRGPFWRPISNQRLEPIGSGDL